MTRSKLRKIRRQKSIYSRSLLRSVPLVSALLAGSGVAQAQQAEEPAGGLEEVIVTATKSSQNLQDVPLSIQAIGTERLEELGVNSFDDFTKFLPNVSVQSGGPGFARVFMRGAASGDNGNHSGSQPSVGQYLDEQPITTIQGALDIHMYDIARVEALGGPQGTLYGANSQAGTIRIITNKPDPSGFDASWALEGNTVAHGGQGYLAEGMINVPLGDRAAIRMVGWAREDAGYIDNLTGSRTFPTSGITINSLAESDYNDADVFGARLALKIDLSDTWSITPTVMGQRTRTNGVYAQESGQPELSVMHWHPEHSNDEWVQSALTVEGKIANLDMTFASSYLKREVDVQSDYSDYSFFYDTLFGSGAYFTDNAGEIINPSQFINGKDGYTKLSNELRFTTPVEYKVHAVFGLFQQRQTHDIQQAYDVAGLNDNSDVTGWDDTFWLTKQWRVDRDKAVFGELTWDISDKFSVMGGARYFEYENSLEGFFGFGLTNPYESETGEFSCFEGVPAFEDGPCKNLDKTVDDKDTTFKVNATYHITDDAMVYFTRSEGFRPGGVNRRGTFPPYISDFLTNYELGWKTSWVNDRLRFNGAIYHMTWDNFQFSFLGENGLTNVTNAQGGAELKGVEADLQWAVTDAFSLYGGFAVQKSELSDSFCLSLTNPDTGEPLSIAECEADFPDLFTAKGTRLPSTPEFKANLTGRYEFTMGGMESYLQGSLVHEGDRRTALLNFENDVLRDSPAYTLLDLSFGFGMEDWTMELFVKNATDKRAVLYSYAECDTTICGGNSDEPPATGIVYSVMARPRMVGLKFSQKF